MEKYIDNTVHINQTPNCNKDIAKNGLNFFCPRCGFTMLLAKKKKKYFFCGFAENLISFFFFKENLISKDFFS